MSINEGLTNTVLADSGPASSSPPGANENGGANQSVPPAPMPRDKRGWHVVPAPDGRGTPQEDKAAPTSSAARLLDLPRGDLGAELDLGAHGPTRRAATGECAVQPLLPVTRAGGPGQVDLLDRRHHPGHLRDQIAVPGQR